ncbi:MAG: DUF309 domain-containing protein [Candidatus Carbobacillus altaicus]|uniref:DUF309 domain-containing protein n=1 Tax=Candidatus Carbonibacillus altaicus TaxID=2163959 RepID=A0A2R6Y4Q1_9BACL|nr:DUF309 domain-containing protein [Candidatus Carbobacillus altaicus]PTQ57623.1 MAG: DUF309 domain-containing protein [Candidatus Carbobacillus altaicus]
MRYPEAYLRFIRLFNEGEFYEAHDVLEELWMEEGHDKFLQALIQLAVAYYHYDYGNVYGARQLLTSARRYFKAASGERWGLNAFVLSDHTEKLLAALPDERKIPMEDARRMPLPEITLIPEGCDVRF